jgi:general secretion pathway protein F
MLTIARLLERLALARNKMLVGLIYPALWLWAAFCGIPIFIAIISPLSGPDELYRVLWSQAKFFASVAAVLFVVIVAFRWIPQHSGLRLAVHGAALVLPPFGATFRRLARARFADTFQALYVAGVRVPEAMARAAAACGNDLIGSRILRTTPMVTEGTSVAAALRQSGVIPTLALSIIETGEMAGKLDESLAKFAQYQHEDLELGIERLAKILPMLAILLMIIILAARVLSQWGAHFNFMNSLMGP